MLHRRAMARSDIRAGVSASSRERRRNSGPWSCPAAVIQATSSAFGQIREILSATRSGYSDVPDPRIDA
jgi:hypothetical protein